MEFAKVSRGDLTVQVKWLEVKTFAGGARGPGFDSDSRQMFFSPRETKSNQFETLQLHCDAISFSKSFAQIQKELQLFGTTKW